MRDMASKISASTISMPAGALHWRAALAFAVLGAGVAGLLVPAGAADLELRTLLRFMAVIKGAMALGAAALAGWRMGWAVRPGVAGAYVLAVSAAAFGSGLIWQLGHVGTGALLVHGGLASLALVAWLDRAGWERAGRTLAGSRLRGVAWTRR